MSAELAEVVQTCCKADVTNINKIRSLEGQRAFLQSLATNCVGDVPKGTNEEGDSSHFESMVTAEKVSGIFIRGNLREVQRLCKYGVEPVSTTVADVVKSARKGNVMNRKNATISN